MKRILSSSTLIACVLSLFGAGMVSIAGCDGKGGGNEGGGGASACFDYSGFDSSKNASFATDVLPIFQRSCGISAGCHGDPNEPFLDRPFLGPNKDTTATPDDITNILDSIVSVAAVQESGLNLVEPNKPELSFLMFKMDGTLECPDLSCAASGKCGTTMPQGAGVLVEGERDIIRRWIAQGAQNN